MSPTAVSNPQKAAEDLRIAMIAAGVLVSPGRARDLVAEMAGHPSFESLEADRSDPVEATGAEAVADIRNEQGRILVRAGIAEHETAYLIVADLSIGVSPTVGTVTWVAHDGGLLARNGSRGYWIGPADDEDRKDPLSFSRLRGRDGEWCMRIGEFEGDVFSAYRFMSSRLVGDEAAGKQLVEEEIREKRLQARDVARLGRKTLDTTKLPAIDTRWGQIDRATDYGRRVWSVGTARHGGFRVPDEVLAQIPALYRQKSSGDGYAYYEEDDEWAILALGLPDLFTEVELRRAEHRVKETFPAIHALRSTSEPPTSDAIRKAHRGFSEERIEFHITGRGPELPDGRRVVSARMSSIWSSRPYTQEDLLRPYCFLIGDDPAAPDTGNPSNDLDDEEDWFERDEIDPDRHPMVVLLDGVSLQQASSPEAFRIVPYEVLCSGSEEISYENQFDQMPLGDGAHMLAFFGTDGPTVAIVRNREILGHAVLGHGCALHRENGAWMLRSGDDEVDLGDLDETTVAALVDRFGIEIDGWRPNPTLCAGWRSFARQLGSHPDFNHEDLDASGWVALYNVSHEPIGNGASILRFDEDRANDPEDIEQHVLAAKASGDAPRP